MAHSSSTSDFLPPVSGVLQDLIPTQAATYAIPQFTTQALKKPVVVYYLPRSATVQQRRFLMAAMTLPGRCQDENPSLWQSWVVSWSVLIFPELHAILQGDTSSVDYSYEEYPADFVREVESAILEFTTSDAPVPKQLTFPIGLPNATLVELNPEVVAASTLEGIYAYYAMVVFVMGKSISPENTRAIAQNRPQALINKRKIDNCSYILTGDGKMSPESYKLIQSGWIRSTRPRLHIVTHLALMNASQSRSELMDAISVNMEMLRNSGQSYLFYIHELLTACPWCIEIPALRSSYYHYVKMVNVLAAQPPYLRPYYKLMMQDSAKEVRRRDVEALISVATFFAAQTRTSMNQYRINQGTLATVALFRSLAESKGYRFEEVQNQQMTEVSAI